MEETQKEVESTFAKKSQVCDVQKRLEAVENVNIERRILLIEKQFKEREEQTTTKAEQQNAMKRNGDQAENVENVREHTIANAAAPSAGGEVEFGSLTTASGYGKRENPSQTRNRTGVAANDFQTNDKGARMSVGERIFKKTETDTSKDNDELEKGKQEKKKKEKEWEKKETSGLVIVQDAAPAPPAKIIKRMETRFPPKPKSCAGNAKQRAEMPHNQTKSQSVYNLNTNEEIRANDIVSDDDADVDEMLSQYSGFGAFMGSTKQLKVKSVICITSQPGLETPV